MQSTEFTTHKLVIFLLISVISFSDMSGMFNFPLQLSFLSFVLFHYCSIIYETYSAIIAAVNKSTVR